MILKKVSELKNAGVWKEFSAPADICLAPRTLIYGFNGSGKTTLSRIFSSIQRGQLEDRLPDGTNFKVEASDGTQVSHDPITNPFGSNLLVFNTDFVARNFEWDASSTKGIAYLSEKKIGAKKEYDELHARLGKLSGDKKSKEKQKGKLEKDISDFKTRVARSIREIATSSSYTQSYDARKIQGHYSKATFASDLRLSNESLKKYQAILASREPLPVVSFSPSLQEGVAEWVRGSLSLVQQSLSVLASDEFELHSNALRWVEEGLHYHEKHELPDCLLCGNPFSSDRRKLLHSLFDKAWTDAMAALNTALTQGREYQQNLREFYRAIPKEGEITSDERGAFAEGKQSFEASIRRLGVCIGELVKSLELKVANPAVSIDLSDDLAGFDLDEWLEGYRAIDQALSSVLKRHNDAFASFASIQKDTFSKIEAHVLATNQSEWDRLQKAHADACTQYDTAVEEERQASDREQELRNDLQDHGVGAEKMNELIWAYLGHRELRLVAEDAGYKIIRPNGQPATELSEGERTAVSFCYFLTQLGAEGRKIDDLILVIDDPISSLDTAARTYAYSLMTRMTKKCAQVVVLTHNANFMNMVKREFQNLQRRDATKQVIALLALDCRCSATGSDRATSLIPMHKLLVTYDSEYHYLFSIVQQAANSKKTDYLFLLPNATRKLLEIFSTFCSPGQSSFAGALMDHHDAVKDKLDVRALERLVQIESHGTMDGLGNLPDLTLEEAIRAAEAAITFIKEVGNGHYRKMVTACA